MSGDEEPVDCEACMAQKPTEPLASDCCGTGCSPCVLDLHDTELATWRRSCDRCHEGGAQTEHREPMENKQQATSCQDALSPDEYRAFKLQATKQITHDTAIYTFRLPGNSKLNLGVGQHIILRGPVNGRFITRQFTPISPPGMKGHFDVLVKVYNDGAMSQYITVWKEDDDIEWRGPYGTFSYQPNQYRRIVMLAAGTGITPMLQVIRHIVINEDDETFVRLVYSSRTYSDILLRETLNELTAYWNFTVLYALSRETPGEHPTSYGESFHYGRIQRDTLAAEMETSPQPETQVLICGTKSFDKDMLNFLKKLEFKGNVFKF
ncbi:NADH-cytochrome b5 reductase-like [Patiria miniata]|uniref:NADH-cytochrome b5 reductase n=1 Tax=Patiria miniata TaxID=46514 RepID=A0A914ASX6_PATMI|nr:NADH-cytochrome b5 reductase-like [Patiria miniata]